MSMTLEELLDDDSRREHFRNFMKERFASEHIDCWCLVRKFKADGLSDAQKFELASEIFEKYVKDDARHQITIDHPLRDAITRMVENNATIPKMFDTLQQVCFSTMRHSLFPEYVRLEGHKMMLKRQTSPQAEKLSNMSSSGSDSPSQSRSQKLEYLRVMVGDDRKTILCSRELNAADCKEHIIEKLCREHNGALTPELFNKETEVYQDWSLFRDTPNLKTAVELYASDVVIMFDAANEQPLAVSMRQCDRLVFQSQRRSLSESLKRAEADVSAAIREMSEAMEAHSSSALKKALREKVDAKSALVQSLSQQLLALPNPLNIAGLLNMITGDSINKYYFNLEDGEFQFYQHCGDAAPHGSVPLEKGVSQVLFSPSNSQTFVVQTDSHRSVFMTNTPEQRLDWMTALAANCERAIVELPAADAIALKKTTASRLRKSKASRKNSLLIPVRRTPSDKGIKKVAERPLNISDVLLKSCREAGLLNSLVVKDSDVDAPVMHAGTAEDICAALWIFHDPNTVNMDLQAWLLMFHHYCSPEQFVAAVNDSWEKVEAAGAMDAKVALDRLSSFVTQVFLGENLYRDSTARAKLRDGLTKLLEPRINNASTMAKIKSGSCKPLPLIQLEAPQVMEGVKVQKGVLEHSTREIASAMTKVETNLFRRVMPYEFVDCMWQKDESQAQGVVALTAHYNQVVAWVTHATLQPTLAKDRMKVLKKFILVGKTLLEMKNYSSAFQIVSALNQRSVTRLKAIKELETVEKYREPLELLRTSFGFSSNFKEYRSLSRSPPFLPVTAVHMRDVVFAHDGLTKWWNDDSKDGIANFLRCTRVSQVIFRMGVHREVTTSAYMDLPPSTCDVLIEEVLQRSYPGEQELFNLSQQREPPAPKQVMTHEQLVDNVERFMSRFEAYTNDYEQRIGALEREVANLRRENRELRHRVGLRDDEPGTVTSVTSSTVTDLSPDEASDSDADGTPKRPKSSLGGLQKSRDKPALPPLPPPTSSGSDYETVSEPEDSD